MVVTVLVAWISVHACLAVSAEAQCESNACNVPNLDMEIDTDSETSTNLLQTKASQKSGVDEIIDTHKDVTQENAKLRADMDLEAEHSNFNMTSAILTDVLANGTAADPVCDAVALAYDQYNCSTGLSTWALCYHKSADFKPVGGAPAGYTVINTFDTVSSQGDVDKATLYKKGDDCWMAFMGDDHHYGDFTTYQTAPVEAWGITGVHEGFAQELQQLLDLMDFDEIRSACKGKLTVGGHSKGGALAQLFSVAINKADDPLDANLTVDFLYTFGSPRVAEEKLSNDKAADGCFSGGQYWWAQKTDSHYIVDVVSPQRQVNQEEVVKSSKLFVFDDGSTESFPCGTPLPESTSSLVWTLGLSTYMQKHLGYRTSLGCP